MALAIFKLLPILMIILGSLAKPKHNQFNGWFNSLEFTTTTTESVLSTQWPPFEIGDLKLAEPNEKTYDCNKNATRIMYWEGYVNQHNNLATGFTWQTDCDGKSGADILMVEYCKKFEPNTKFIRKCKGETSTTWRNIYDDTRVPYNNHYTIHPYECVTDLSEAKVPRIMYWQGKVNQHNDITTGWTWQTDCDGVSGAEINQLTYCRKFYPNTISVRKLAVEVSNTWRDRHNTVGPYTNTYENYSYECVQPE